MWFFFLVFGLEQQQKGKKTKKNKKKHWILFKFFQVATALLPVSLTSQPFSEAANGKGRKGLRLTESRKCRPSICFECLYEYYSSTGSTHWHASCCSHCLQRFIPQKNRMKWQVKLTGWGTSDVFKTVDGDVLRGRLHWSLFYYGSCWK